MVTAIYMGFYVGLLTYAYNYHIINLSGHGRVIIIARPSKKRCICSKPLHTCFAPVNCVTTQTVTIGYDEYEVIRQIDYAHLSQAQCAEKMGVSRATVARMYDRARSTIAEAIIEGKQLRIRGGEVEVCTALKPECVNVSFCCHKMNDSEEGGHAE